MRAGPDQAPRHSRIPALLRPVGRSRWGMASALAAGLGAVLALPVVQGHAALGSALALGFVLTAVPSLPASWRAAVPIIAIRAAAVVAGAALVVLFARQPAAFAALVVAAAVVGALVERIGATAGLALVLVAVDAGPAPPFGVLVPYATGAAAVLVAWTMWWLCAKAVRRHAVEGAAGAPAPVQRADRWTHSARVAAAVTLAVLTASWLPDNLVGGHWLVTSVLLTVQPGRAATGLRLTQRLTGNTVGAALAAVLLGSHPAVAVAIPATVLLFLLAVALRPVNYTWWAVTGPPVLLVISEYPHWFPWYEGGVRLGMNLGGAAIVVLVVFVAPTVVCRFRRRDSSDSVYKIQIKEAG
ncbi:FUSC family protein [Mycolicibacterium sp. S2-37]|uniref:FUSC family protein n=1 Tax=Mycolicibacterium sp. S2-37 TaxID=2810297 RepID=UPI001A951426|nr:FUSC family protein [Mycolicibacterium sp. S2-37]MBO0677204.1 FUSC family protein [Mycolicibacterium sp. S2-37]